MCGVSSDWHEGNHGDALLVEHILFIKSFAGRNCEYLESRVGFLYCSVVTGLPQTLRVTSLQFVLHTPCQFYEVIVPHDGQMSPQLVWFDFTSVKVKHRMMDGHGWNGVSVFLVLNRFCFAMSKCNLDHRIVFM